MRLVNFVFGTVVLASIPTIAWAADEGYESLPSQSARSEAGSGWVVLDFPRTELVKEGDGAVNKVLAAPVADPVISDQMSRGHFTSLQVRDLAVKPRAIFSEGNAVHIPYVVSVKHTQGKQSALNPNQGTINVSGEILVHYDGKDLHVSVTKFDDSQEMERIGRKLGFNSEIDLSFAKAIVSPVLESWYNSDPARIQKLLAMAPTLQEIKKP